MSVSAAAPSIGGLDPRNRHDRDEKQPDRGPHHLTFGTEVEAALGEGLWMGCWRLGSVMVMVVEVWSVHRL